MRFLAAQYQEEGMASKRAICVILEPVLLWFVFLKLNYLLFLIYSKVFYQILRWSLIKSCKLSTNIFGAREIFENINLCLIQKFTVDMYVKDTKLICICKIDYYKLHTK